MDGARDQLSAGWAALASGHWNTAKECFLSVLDERESPEAHDGLGMAYWWLNEIESAHHHRTLAYAGYKSDGNLRRAAFLASWLAREHVFLHGNTSAMRGWFARAERLLADAGPCAESGWFRLFRASMLAEPEELEAVARASLTLAREFQDLNLEAVALAFGGMAQVVLGRVDEGMVALDEAMATATDGELDNLAAVSEVFCVLLSACELAGDLTRTEDWCRIVAEFAERHQCSFLSAYCRTTYGGLLSAAGKWGDAEAELLAAIRGFETGHRALRVHAVLKLADLRISQGRLEEAAALLAGYEDQAAIVPLARLHLARGETALAKAILDQTLTLAPSSALHQAPLLLLLVEVTLALDDLDGARQAAERLARLAENTGGDILLAQADLAQGHVKRRANEPDAVRCFRSAMERLRGYEQSLFAGRARLEMARTLAGDDWAGAVTWARAALACFRRLGAARDADEAAGLLRRLGVADRPRPHSFGELTAREAQVLTLVARGLTNREIAERLVISVKTVEHHVSQILTKIGARSRAEAAAMAVSLGEAGSSIGPDPETIREANRGRP